MILSKSDFYRILVETNLLSTYTITYVMANDMEEELMELQEHTASVDEVRWICWNKISTGKKVVRFRTCNGSESIRSNTWFSKSKLRIAEILLFTYYWWNNIPMTIFKREYFLFF